VTWIHPEDADKCEARRMLVLKIGYPAVVPDRHFGLKSGTTPACMVCATA